jgi:hypothetical protein
MKRITKTRKSERGSILVAGLILTIILGITLASYLLLVRNQNLSVVRSQNWNRAFVLTEAGIEDALAMLNKNTGNFENLYRWTNLASLSADNWSVVRPNVYHTRRMLEEDYYDVYITNLNNRPTVFAVGTVTWNAAGGYSSGHLATLGTASPSSAVNLARRVEVRTRLDPIFNFAMAAINSINLNGRNVATDSFDSADPNHSTGGLYDRNKSKDEGDVVTNDIITGALNVGNARIKGLVKTGPQGTVDIGPNGSVGDSDWVDGGNTGIQSGHFADDMNVLWDPAGLPSDASWLPAVGSPAVLANYSTNGVTYDYVFLQSGDYYISSFSRGIYVPTNVNVRLRISGNVSMTGGGTQVYIGQTGASLKIYMQGTTFKIGGNGIVNASGNAANFQYYGLPSNTSVQFVGNGAFVGSIYAPNADFQLGGGGNNTYDFVGASVTRTVRMNGHFNFHYDENLRRVGPGRGYVPTHWKES